ncbi:adenosine deaminase-like protein [Scaptodrosophila lebanonensis]|uniref:Adenosine deaminase-like protein n=1 Tax=Drosophila lebanonensis TaxID=7225 RepID=A0A6J2TMQ3_DROLE|nr:adenosine deaminase-like protein [Scaptodrosophila lebanonensis]
MENFKFLNNLPKVELHAHLNGSLNIAAMLELGEKVYGKKSAEFTDLCERLTKFEPGCILDECFKRFAFVHDLTSTKEGLRYATELVIRDFAVDHVMYLELRTTPKSNKNMTRREYVQIVLDAIKEARQKFSNIRVKLLLSINRAEPVAVADETVTLALEFFKSEPDIVVGMDLSGNPNKGEFKAFTSALHRAGEGGLRLTLHCAEVNNPKETKEMLEFGMSRCGHGTHLSAEDIAYLRNHDIPVECCLTSNIKTGTVSSFVDHHLKRLMEAEAPTVLCTDDCGIFDTTLTKEFCVASQSLGMTDHQCIDLTMQAIKYSFATEADRSWMIQQVNKYAKGLENTAFL